MLNTISLSSRCRTLLSSLTFVCQTNCLCSPCRVSKPYGCTTRSYTLYYSMVRSCVRVCACARVKGVCGMYFLAVCAPPSSYSCRRRPSTRARGGGGAGVVARVLCLLEIGFLTGRKTNEAHPYQQLIYYLSRAAALTSSVVINLHFCGFWFEPFPLASVRTTPFKSAGV